MRSVTGGDTVIHIHHHGLDPEDPFQADAPGAAVQPVATAVDGEVTYIKNVSSAFIGTSLEADLRKSGIGRLVTCGATANHCVQTTTRMAGNLGFDTIYASDGVWAYATTGPDGIEHSAEQIHSISLANLQGEFANVLSTQEILAL